MFKSNYSACAPTVADERLTEPAPTEVNSLLGDASKAKSKLGWTPKLTLDEIVEEMIINEVNFMYRP